MSIFKVEFCNSIQTHLHICAITENLLNMYAPYDMLELIRIYVEKECGINV